MANDSSTPFGLRPLRNVGQSDHNAGLGEWMKLTGSAAIYHHELTTMQASGYVISAGAGGGTNVGSLNGSFYTDPTTSKPTWSTYAPNVAASDHVCLINDNPQTMFEMMTIRTDYVNPTVVGANADIVVGTGSTTSPFVSQNSLGAIVGATLATQIRILGLTRDTGHQDVSVAGSVWRVMINEHLLGNNAVGI